eukprot:TRINITY_DN1857_c0_g1_i5.p1 TRINITY_DN1857_c0_g1~~TRINITY_DN1857_c0_g1_i5.p1  ORF type:complete len:413 (-),score=144.82 TRINITY_DN1857_c0_g1_i5:438-1676(-)
MGVIDERAISNLSLAAELTKNIEMKLSKGKEKREAIANITPKFMWILKDFALDLVDEYGRNITSSDYLEDCINPSKVTVREGPGESAYKIREAIVKLFRQRECMVFVRPVEDEMQLQNLNSLSLRDMRPEFRQQFEVFRNKIFLECPTKMMNNKPVNGRMMGYLLEQYIKAINEGAVPNISTAWENVLDSEVKRLYENAMKVYKDETDKLATLSELPIEQEELVKRLFRIRMKSENIMDNGSKFSDSESTGRLQRAYITKLSNLYKAKEEEIKSRNARLSQEYSNTSPFRQCHSKLQSAVATLEKKIMENKYNLDNTGEIKKDIDELIVEYEKEAKGPAKLQVLAKEMPKLVKKLLGSAARNNRERIDKFDSEYKLKLQEMETKTGLDKQELERLQDTEKATRDKVSSHNNP